MENVKMLGALAGDIIGSVYELRNTKSMDFELFCGASAFTDDSVMTLAVAKWLMEDESRSPWGLTVAMLAAVAANIKSRSDVVRFMDVILIVCGCKGTEKGRETLRLEAESVTSGGGKNVASSNKACCSGQQRLLLEATGAIA